MLLSHGSSIVETQENAIWINIQNQISAFPRPDKIVIAFSRKLLLKGTIMAQRGPALFTATPRSMSRLAIIFLVLAAFFALLNSHKVKALRANVTTAQTISDASSGRDRVATKSNAGTAVAETRAANAETALAQAEEDKADLQAKLDATQQEIAALKERAAATNGSAPGNAAASAENSQGADLQSQVDDLRGQLDSAEKEKALLAEKLEEAQRTAQVKEPAKESKKKRDTASTQRESASSHRAGVHGTVLAYNQAYNFVVLNLGARNGVEPNSEMLVLRDGTLIGKIRISSVEPATAIGDIITNSLARGVQVQAGDNVIYAGTNP
jgi:cell shape-determining protein MreC